MKLNAAVETEDTGLWYGRFIELIGTHARAETFEQLLNELREEAFYHDNWLMRHGEKPLNLDDLLIDVKECVDGVSMLGESGGMVALFTYDLERVDETHLEKCIRYMGYNRSDLLRLLEGVSKETLEYTPPNKQRNIVQILSHICNAEEWYISRMGSDAQNMYERNLGITIAEAGELNIFERMKLVRGACYKTLRRILPNKVGTFTREKYARYPEEKWSARKVLRRFLEHEREHIYNIRWYLGRDQRDLP